MRDSRNTQVHRGKLLRAVDLGPLGAQERQGQVDAFDLALPAPWARACSRRATRSSSSSSSRGSIFGLTESARWLAP